MSTRENYRASRYIKLRKPQIVITLNMRDIDTLRTCALMSLAIKLRMTRNAGFSRRDCYLITRNILIIQNWSLSGFQTRCTLFNIYTSSSQGTIIVPRECKISIKYCKCVRRRKMTRNSCCRVNFALIRPCLFALSFHSWYSDRVALPFLPPRDRLADKI